MSRIEPYHGSSLDNFVALLNAVDDTKLVYGVDFTLGRPQPCINRPGMNTSVQFLPLLFNGGFSSQLLFYNRLDLSVIGELPNGCFSPVEIASLPTSSHQILDQINKALGLNLTRDEIEDTPYALDATDDDFIIRVASDSSSYEWVGEYCFDVIIDGGNNELDNLIVNLDLGAIPSPKGFRPGEFDAQAELFKMLIAANPGLELQLSDVVFEKPAGNGIDIPGLVTSTLIVAPAPGSKYYEGVRVNYYRQAFTNVNPDPVFVTEQPVRMATVVDFLNNQLNNAHIAVSDIVPFDELQLAVGDIGTITVKTTDTSLTWAGSIDINYLFGLPSNVDALHQYVNVTLPSPGYLR